MCDVWLRVSLTTISRVRFTSFIRFVGSNHMGLFSAITHIALIIGLCATTASSASKSTTAASAASVKAYIASRP